MRAMAAALVLLALAMTGCSTVGTRHTEQGTGVAAGPRLSAFPVLEVRPFTTTQGYEAFGEHVAKTRGVLLEYLPAEGLFQEIVADGKPGSAGPVLVLDARLIRAKSVSRTERVMLGIMAGRSGIEMEATLTDRASGAPVAKDLIVVQSALGAGVAGATDRETINHMAREIINFLKQRR